MGPCGDLRRGPIAMLVARTTVLSQGKIVKPQAQLL
jgi:hypothetical protein